MGRPFSLTEKDRQVHAYLIDHIRDHGYAPTVREMCEHFGLSSTNTMQSRLDRLVRHGLIERVGARAIRITNA